MKLTTYRFVYGDYDVIQQPNFTLTMLARDVDQSISELIEDVPHFEHIFHIFLVDNQHIDYLESVVMSDIMFNALDSVDWNTDIVYFQSYPTEDIVCSLNILKPAANEYIQVRECIEGE